MTLDECRAHVGAGVVYEPADGRREDGVITSVNSMYAFVRFGTDAHSKATHPGQLELGVTAK